MTLQKKKSYEGSLGVVLNVSDGFICKVLTLHLRVERKRRGLSQEIKTVRNI